MVMSLWPHFLGHLVQNITLVFAPDLPPRIRVLLMDVPYTMHRNNILSLYCMCISLWVEAFIIFMNNYNLIA